MLVWEGLARFLLKFFSGTILMAQRRQNLFARFEKQVAARGGICLSHSEDHENTHSKLLVRCGYGHEFRRTPNSLDKGVWCPECNTSQGELIMRTTLEHLFRASFIKVRPDWLTNDEGNRLELDAYCDKLKIAGEFNGPHHYEVTWHKSKVELQKQQRHDQIKREDCSKKGITLFVVPYWISLKSIPTYLRDEAGNSGFSVNEEPFDFDSAFSKTDRLMSLKRIVAEKKGKLIKYQPVGQCKFKCEKNHVFSLTRYSLEAGSWCPQCKMEDPEREVKDAARRRKISETLAVFYKTSVGKTNKKIAHEKRSCTMKRKREETRSSIQSKKCGRCGEEKPFQDENGKPTFSKKSNAQDGYQSYCTVCINNIKKQSRKRTKQEGILFECDVCKIKYELKESLTRHRKEKHSNETSTVIFICITSQGSTLETRARYLQSIHRSRLP
jgi:hypothetical protein